MISILMPYYERISQLNNTLDSYNKANYKDIEVIIIDDGSPTELTAKKLIKTQFQVLIIRLQPSNFHNPCVPYNIALNKAIGDLCLITSPEVLHTSDLLTPLAKNLFTNEMRLASCLAISEPGRIIPTSEELSSTTCPPWYTHSSYRPMAYPFCALINTATLKEINGWDEDFRKGDGFDDDDLIRRLKKIGVFFIYDDSLLSIHQWHPSNWSDSNKLLFETKK